VRGARRCRGLGGEVGRALDAIDVSHRIFAREKLCGINNLGLVRMF
jgi:hypothetical protein